MLFRQARVRPTAENAELVAFGVGQHDPRHVALLDVGMSGAEAQQAGDLYGLIIWLEIEMQPVLVPLGVRDLP